MASKLHPCGFWVRSQVGFTFGRLTNNAGSKGQALCLGGILSHPFLAHLSLLDFPWVFLGISVISDLLFPSDQLCRRVLPAGLGSSPALFGVSLQRWHLPEALSPRALSLWWLS